MSQPSSLPKDSVSASTLTSTQASASKYEPPAIIHCGVLETRAGSPVANPLSDLTDPGSPIK